MSAQDELPPGCTPDGQGGFEFADVDGGVLHGIEDAGQAWEVFYLFTQITREELTTMRAAVERCREAEGEIKVQGHMLNTQYLEAEDDRAKCEAWEERATKAEAALAKVTAERDAERRRVNQLKVYADALEGSTRPGFWEAE